MVLSPCVFTCRAQIKLELSVQGLPAASSSSIIVVHLSVVVAVLLSRGRTAVVQLLTPKEYCMFLTIQTLDVTRVLFCFVILLQFDLLDSAHVHSYFSYSEDWNGKCDSTGFTLSLRGSFFFCIQNKTFNYS